MRKHYQWAWLILVWLIPHLLFAQERQYSGTIISASDNNPIPGVNVVIKGTITGVVTDFDGNFKISAEQGTTLVISYIGFKTQEVLLGGTSSLSVKLEEDVTVLGDVVVVGYGSLSKKDVTGAITTIGSKDFQTGVVTTPEQLIAGKAAGVQIVQNGGSPGAGSTIRIRGAASLNASNDPLIVIDGVPVDNGGIAGSPNPLSLINPNDIETFTILKDASATAIYGSRASNGVIMITTKKGTKGMKPSFNFSTQNSVALIRRKVEVLDADEFRALVTNPENRATAAQIRRMGKSNTNWQDEIYRPAFTTDNNLSYTGDLAKLMPMRASLGFLSQQGILKTDKMDRISAGLNLSPTFLKGNLKVNLNLKGSLSKNNFANQGAIGAAATFDPTQSVDDSTNQAQGRYGGYFEYLDNRRRPNQLAPRNPVGLLNQRQDQSNVLRSIGNLQVDYALPFLPDLRVNLNLGYDVAQGNGTVEVPDSAASNYFTRGQFSEYRQDKRNTLAEFFLNYQKNLDGINSRIDLLAGTAYQDFLTTNYAFRTLTFRRDTLAAIPRPVFPLDKPQNRLISFYTRLNYAFMERLILTATMRWDGSSRFSPDTRWGAFPSAALAYRLTEENFIKNQNVISDIKARVGWGVTGQQDIGANYGHLSVYGISSNTAMYQFGNNFFNMARPSAYDPNIKWEQTTTWNAGVDFGFLKDRITASVDVYYKDTKDLLNVVPTPAGANFSDQVLTNVGSIENRGIELSINTVALKTEKLEWNIGFNVTSNVNKITKLNTQTEPGYQGVPTGGISGGVGNNIQIQSVGHPLNSFFVYQQIYGADGKPVEGQYVDRNSDGVVNASDLYRYKNPAPVFFYGINSNLSYGKFSAGLVIRGSQGNYVYNNVYSNLGTINTVLSRQDFLVNASKNVLETNFNGNLQGADNSKRLLSDYYVQNASFIRLDNLTFGYDFGSFIHSKTLLRANLNLQNFFVISKYKGVDPEIFGGIDNNFYPRPRVITLGLNLSFQ